jgi:hypothetical protein
MNHKNSNKSKNHKLSGYDIEYHYYLMNDERRKQNQIREMNGDLEGFKPLFQTAQMPEKYRFTVTRVAGGVSLDCNKERCLKCNGCVIDISKDDLETAHCQRCICYTEEEQSENLNDTGIPLGELVRKRQGSGFKNSGGLK